MNIYVRRCSSVAAIQSGVPSGAISAALLKAAPDEEADDMADAASASDANELYARRPSSAILFTALTALFTAVALLFVFALVSLNFSAG